LLAPIVAREVHRDDPQQVSIQQPKHIMQYSEADYWRIQRCTAMRNVEITFWQSDSENNLSRSRKKTRANDAAIRKMSKHEDEQQSLEENARSLIVNYHCEASNHGRGNSKKRLFSPSTHSRFLEVLSESINFAAQGLCEGTPVVSRSCRCSEQIGCIFE
jgi:hypothetical protein